MPRLPLQRGEKKSSTACPPALNGAGKWPDNGQEWVKTGKNARSGPLRQVIPPKIAIFDLKIGFPTKKDVF